MAYTRREDIDSAIMRRAWVLPLVWQKRAGQWDQFEANERLFGVQNTYACRPPQNTSHPAPDKCRLACPGRGPAVDHPSSTVQYRVVLTRAVPGERGSTDFRETTSIAPTSTASPSGAPHPRARIQAIGQAYAQQSCHPSCTGHLSASTDEWCTPGPHCRKLKMKGASRCGSVTGTGPRPRRRKKWRI